MLHRYDEPRGYAAGFVSVVDYVDRLIPSHEQIGKAFRTEHPRFGLTGRNSSQVSQVIRLARDRGLIQLAGPAHPRGGYAPFWA